MAVLPTEHRALKRHGISSAFRPANTIGQHLFMLKVKKDTSKSADAIDMIGCMSYIEETARTLYVQHKDHRVETVNITQVWAQGTRGRNLQTLTTILLSLNVMATSNHVIDWEIIW